ncbi:unnamed protein product [Gadus morhua 'NCC']
MALQEGQAAARRLRDLSSIAGGRAGSEPGFHSTQGDSTPMEEVGGSLDRSPRGPVYNMCSPQARRVPLK